TLTFAAMPRVRFLPLHLSDAARWPFCKCNGSDILAPENNPSVFLACACPCRPPRTDYVCTIVLHPTSQSIGDSGPFCLHTAPPNVALPR
ncbi:hypothetical protein GGF41_001378, partial [Coemansia sp. RSA 2531]